jgi:hypothetical protein
MQRSGNSIPRKEGTGREKWSVATYNRETDPTGTWRKTDFCIVARRLSVTSHPSTIMHQIWFLWILFSEGFWNTLFTVEKFKIGMSCAKELNELPVKCLPLMASILKSTGHIRICLVLCLGKILISPVTFTVEGTYFIVLLFKAGHLHNDIGSTD